MCPTWDTSTRPRLRLLGDGLSQINVVQFLPVLPVQIQTVLVLGPLATETSSHGTNIPPVSAGHAVLLGFLFPTGLGLSPPGAVPALPVGPAPSVTHPPVWDDEEGSVSVGHETLPDVGTTPVLLGRLGLPPEGTRGPGQDVASRLKPVTLTGVLPEVGGSVVRTIVKLSRPTSVIWVSKAGDVTQVHLSVKVYNGLSITDFTRCTWKIHIYSDWGNVRWFKG